MVTAAFVIVVAAAAAVTFCQEPLPHFDIQMPVVAISKKWAIELQIDQFFKVWATQQPPSDAAPSNDYGRVTLLAPKNSAANIVDKYRKEANEKELVRHLLLNHVIRGDLSQAHAQTLGGATISVHHRNGDTYLSYLTDDDDDDNDIMVRKVVELNDGVKIAIIDNYLTMSSAKMNALKQTHPFITDLLNTLTNLNASTKTYQQFVAHSNVTQLLQDDEDYTVFVPIDFAFQRWHPIDWGFYPFSVPEFTESIIVNHFVRGTVALTDGTTVKSLADHRAITVQRSLYLTVNGVPVENVTKMALNSHSTIVLLNEVMFVNNTIVTELQKRHRDHETPPLLAHPWLSAQFLSHAYLALKDDARFKHISRFLNAAELAPFVPGANYTFFVPTDEAFAHTNLPTMPDNYLANERGRAFLLNHFVRGHWYDRDLHDGQRINTMAKLTITISRNKESVMLNSNATILESEVFVYNLGTMYYIDRILFPETLEGILPPPTSSAFSGAPLDRDNPQGENFISKESEELKTRDRNNKSVNKENTFNRKNIN